MPEHIPSLQEDLESLIRTTLRDVRSLSRVIPPALTSYGLDTFRGEGSVRRIARNVDTQKPIIYFDHGYGANNFTQPILPLLANKGYEIYAFAKPFLYDIRRQAELSSKQLQKIAQQNSRNIVMLGHSMGGITQAVIAKEIGLPSNVKKIISLASPYLGTLLACFGPGKSARQMEPGNNLALRLYQKDLPPGVELTCFVPTYDNVVSAESGLDHRAINILFARYNHLSIIESERVAFWIDHVIQKDHKHFEKYVTRRFFQPSLQRRLQRIVPPALRKRAGLVRMYEEFDRHEYPLILATQYELESGFHPYA
ncbi:hypothetical protein D6774_03070 [Candidatus Woesearchaeota archaeon]|nr:MAG: hypothetical protein D6774_03070 [Candidatus Woesearchaeota archaeon]